MFDPSSFPYVNPLKERKVALITGGNSGIGWYTALHLYLHGYVVYVAGRSRSRVIKSLDELKAEAQKIAQEADYSGNLGEFYFLEIELTSLASVSDAVERFQRKEGSLHVLVNNAGVMAIPYALTIDGYETQMQTNFVAPFLLTSKLLPLLENASRDGGNEDPPRVIYLSSVGHRIAFKYFNLHSKFNYKPSIIFSWFHYGLAKTCGIHFMKMMAWRHPNILCMSVHPGFVMSTNLFSYWTRLPIVGIIFWCFFQIFGYFFGVSNEEGSFATIRCCLDPTLSLEKDNGKYFATGGKEASPSNVASDLNYAARTWTWTVNELSKHGYEISM